MLDSLLVGYSDAVPEGVSHGVSDGVPDEVGVEEGVGVRADDSLVTSPFESLSVSVLSVSVAIPSSLSHDSIDMRIDESVGNGDAEGLDDSGGPF